MSADALRVAFLAGTLGTGGAEKQLVYLVKGLQAAGVRVRVYALTEGEANEAALEAAGVRPEWVGRWSNPIVRVGALARRLRSFRPDIVHSAHFYTNLHVAAAGRLAGAMSIGTVRSNGVRDLRFHPFWGKALLAWPDGLIVNSEAALENVARFRRHPDQVRFLPNVLDVAEFDRRASENAQGPGVPPVTSGSRAIVVGRLVKAKRIDRFLRVIALAARTDPGLRGLVVGDGPERAGLEALAGELGLLPDRVSFVGERTDVPALLAGADMLLLTSDEEGFPNVLLEAMAARLPVVTTPAGDAARIVRAGVTGEVVPFASEEAFASHVVDLARSPSKRAELGGAARLVVEAEYGSARCAPRALGTYAALAKSAGRRDIAEMLAA